MKVVWTDDDVEEAADAYDEQMADAVRDDLRELGRQLDGVERKAGTRRRMDTVWKNFVGERYIRPEDRAFRTVYIITGYGVVYYDVIRKRKDKQDALFRNFEGNREQVVKDAELNAAVDVVNRAQDQRTETNRAQDRSPADQTILHSTENNAGS